MTLRARLTLGFLAIAVLLLIPLAMSLKALSDVRQETEDLQRGDFAASQIVALAVRALGTARAAERLYPLDQAWGPVLQGAMDTLDVQADSLVALRDPEVASSALRLRALVDSLRGSVPLLVAAVAAQDETRLDSLSEGTLAPLFSSTEATLREIGTRLQERSQDIANAAASRAENSFITTQWAFAFALLLAAIVAVQITRSISRPVRELDRGMQAVAEGDFKRPLRIHPDRTDEFGRLAGSYHEMARRLAELDKLKAEFVSVASHELKTPINVILGYLQLLDEGLYGPLTPRQREVIATLSAQGQALARLVQQLLDISRFEAGGGRLELRDVDLERFVSELEAAFHVLALQRDVRFQVLLGEALPETVCWDADRMNEVLGNLLSNAFKFTERGGRVDLEVTPGPDSVQIMVRDTGAGIAPSQLPHVFRKFYQADNQSAAAVKGTGLGLAISKEIVEAHGGEITVDSTPGVGTTFVIQLPVRAVRRGSGPSLPVVATQGAAS